MSTDNAGYCATAIVELTKESSCPRATGHRPVKYRTNIVEADLGKRKRLARPTLGYKAIKTLYVTTSGSDVLHPLKGDQAYPGRYQDGIMAEVRPIERSSGLAAVRATRFTKLFRFRLSLQQSRRCD